MGKEYDRIKRNKKHRYKKDGFVAGYVPGETIRPITQELGDIVISNPIVVEQVIRTKGTNYIQTLTPIDTTSDGDLATLDAIDKAPVPNTNVLIVLNGRLIIPADGPGGLSTAAAWFESTDGLTIRAFGTVQIGDKLKWNGSYSGIEILSTDELILIYEVDAI